MGLSPEDRNLLDRYARTGDQAAFGELARRYTDLVYSAAARRLGDRHLAEDVTQAVFIILATRPNAALRSGALGGWLLATVRYAAANAVKIEKRRRRHEARAAEAAGAGGCSANPSDVLVWQEVAAQLDDAVLRLPKLDRRAVILRYFEQRGVGDVARSLGVSEGAAKQRLSRSLEKLRCRLDRRGAGAALGGAAELASLLSAHAVGAAPPGLAASVASAAGAGAAAGATALTIAKGAMTMMNLTKLQVAAAVLAVASVVGTGAVMTVRRGQAQAQDGPTAAAAGGAKIAEKAAARVRAAEAVLGSLAQRQEAGEALTPEFIELKGTAQRRLMEARLDAATSPAARVQAAEQGVQQLLAMHKIIKARVDAGLDVSTTQLRQVEYYVADAEYTLAKVRG